MGIGKILLKAGKSLSVFFNGDERHNAMRRAVQAETKALQQGENPAKSMDCIKSERDARRFERG